MKRIITLFPVLLYAMLTVAQADWTPASMIQYKRLTGAVISPNGKRVAYAVSTPVMEGDQSEYLTHVWVATTDGITNRQFTFGNKSCFNPQFSPDGKWLSFLSSRTSEGKNQLYLMPVDGGEGEPITKTRNGIGTYVWAPDGKSIAFLMADVPTEQEEKDKKEKRDMVVADVYRNAHLYTVAVAKNNRNEHAVKRLTSGSFHVTEMVWSADSKVIAFTHQTNASLDLWTTSDISAIPADSGAVKTLVAGSGADIDPAFSPDGQWLAYRSDGGVVKWAARADVYVMPAGGGSAKKLAATHDQSLVIEAWSADSKNVMISEPFKTTAMIYSLPMDGKPPKRLTPMDGLYSGATFTKAFDVMACVYQNVSSPPQVLLLNLKDSKSRILTNLNADLLKKTHAKTEVISWKSKDGKYDIEGLVTYPSSYQKGKKYPLILNIHGGPMGVFSQSYTGASGVYPLQAFAHDGYAVLRPNPRGSSGYGADFRQANINDWGFGDYDDIMGGVDKLIADGVVHPDSLCVTGWSYGGYMTSVVITKTNRFKAAMVGAGVTNLISFTGTADIPGFIPSYFDGEMWDRTEVYIKHSPMFAVENVKTPTLVIHGDRDLRVPLSQGQELYAALKRLGVKTQMVTYPRTPHGPQEPKFIQDIGERVMQWFNTNCRSANGKATKLN